MQSLKYFLLQNTVYKKVRLKSIEYTLKCYFWNHVKITLHGMNRYEFLQLKCSIPSGSKVYVYYFQETSVKLVYFEDLSTGICIIPEPTTITGATERVHELTNISYINGIRSFTVFCPTQGKTTSIRISNWWALIL